MSPGNVIVRCRKPPLLSDQELALADDSGGAGALEVEEAALAADGSMAQVVVVVVLLRTRMCMADLLLMAVLHGGQPVA
jgi:hypothetical protein